MPVNWIDVSALSFNTLLLLERVQLGWFPGWVPEGALAIALRANPVVEWYLRHKCLELGDWLDDVMRKGGEASGREVIRQAEVEVLRVIGDLVVYVVDPSTYDRQPFLKWDSRELTSLVDFKGATVVDVGAGTGRLALVAAKEASAVFAVEPVANMRSYLKSRALESGLRNVYPADGLITEIPFPDGFADVTMGGHVFGDCPEAEYTELARVTKPAGLIILCPGNRDEDNGRHRFLVSKGFKWACFEEPVDGTVRKYWRTA